MTGDKRRLQILKAAVRLFSKNGFRGTTTKKIAKAAGISEAMVFRHFANKEELYSAILDHKACNHGLENPFEEVSEQIKNKDDYGVFYGLALNALKHHREDDEFIRLLLYSGLEGHDLSRMFFESFVKGMYESLSSYIRTRQQDGAFKEYRAKGRRAGVRRDDDPSLDVESDIRPGTKIVEDLRGKGCAFIHDCAPGRDQESLIRGSGCGTRQDRPPPRGLRVCKMSLSKSLHIAFLSALLALLAAGCANSSANDNTANAEENEAAPVTVRTEAAKVEQIPTYIEATGTLASDAESDVAPTIGGKISKVLFDVGSYVTKGDVLVKLDARDAEIRLRQALSQLDQQNKAVAQAEAGVDQAVATLRQTQVRLGVRDGESFDIEDFSQVISVTAQLKLAEAELRRYENLLETGDVSRSAYDLKRSQRDSLIGQLAEARSNAAVAIRAINTAEAGVKAAKTQVDNAKAAVATSETQVAQARKTLSDNVILSPISGYVSERNADPGEYISPNQPNAKLATIVRTAVLRLRMMFRNSRSTRSPSDRAFPHRSRHTRTESSRARSYARCRA